LTPASSADRPRRREVAAGTEAYFRRVAEDVFEHCAAHAPIHAASASGLSALKRAGCELRMRADDVTAGIELADLGARRETLACRCNRS
jgi:hypothetical protein